MNPRLIRDYRSLIGPAVRSYVFAMAMPPPNPQYNPGAPFNPSTQFNPAPQPAQGKRRWGLVIIGILVAVLGLGALVVGAFAGFVEQTRSALDPEAEGRVPGSLSFDADDTKYVVSVQSERFGASASTAANVVCTVTLANGSTIDLDGGRQAIAEESGNIATVGSFDGVAGRTTIACTSPDEIRFFVDDESDVKRLSIVGMIVGAIVLAIGAALILVGVFVRKKPASGSAAAPAWTS